MLDARPHDLGGSVPEDAPRWPKLPSSPDMSHWVTVGLNLHLRIDGHQVRHCVDMGGDRSEIGLMGPADQRSQRIHHELNRDGTEE